MKRPLWLLLIACIISAAGVFPLHAFTPGSVHVTVRDFYSEAPLAGAAVSMTPGEYSGTTGADGTVTFSGITPYRNYAVAVIREGFTEGKYGDGRTGFVTVETGRATEVLIPMRQSASISGAVTSCGKPVGSAMVVVLESRIDGMEQVAAARTGRDGTYELPAVPEGTFSIRAVADGYYQTAEDLSVSAGEKIVRDFSIRPGLTLLSYTIKTTKNYYGNSLSVQPDNLLIYLFNTFYYVPVDMPEGAQLVKSSSTSITPTLPGEYTFAMIVIDWKGVGREVVRTFEMINDPARAYPSVIPGPSELPLLYNDDVYAETSGLAGVQPGERVCLRGWGRDFNLPSPGQFNPDAPMFDIYGNKNGDWGQSAFSFAWTLRDGSGNDATGLLDDPSNRNVSFTVPGDARTGDTYTATLSVTGDAGLAGDPADVTVYVAETVGTDSCLSCHKTIHTDYMTTKHAGAAVGCEDCHGPGSLHSGDTDRISTTHWPGMCGRCHDEFAQWQKSRHSDPLAFGHGEVSSALQRNCYKCHYTEGFIGAAASGNVETFNYPFGTEAPVDTPNVGCDVCHDPHKQDPDNPGGLRTGGQENLCNTCHEKKWQNATYEAAAGDIGNGYHWDDYSAYQGSGNPHRMEDGCVACHMAGDVSDTDNSSVRLVGGHGLRMRDAGFDGDPGTADDILNSFVCRDCHTGLDTFDRNGFQSRIRQKLAALGDLLKGVNHGFLPPFQPGKCATCHRGGTLPFVNDNDAGDLVNAYKNYSLILHDRSFGIHNPRYIERLLDDSIAAVERVNQ